MGVRLLIDLSRSSTGRLEGQISPQSGGPLVRFSGVLEMLTVLEDFAPDPRVLGGVGVPLNSPADRRPV